MRDPAIHEEVIARVRGGIEAAGFRFEAVMASPVPGAVGGNKEFLAHFSRVEVPDGSKDSQYSAEGNQSG